MQALCRLFRLTCMVGGYGGHVRTAALYSSCGRITVQAVAFRDPSNGLHVRCLVYWHHAREDKNLDATCIEVRHPPSPPNASPPLYYPTRNFSPIFPNPCPLSHLLSWTLSTVVLSCKDFFLNTPFMRLWWEKCLKIFFVIFENLRTCDVYYSNSLLCVYPSAVRGTLYPRALQEG